ncbi:MAG TPA: hypothetical protein VMU12_01425, partial [Candidatus Paceibacterota bacterium]|nr:hypothetical protein [Candidatus Paceibacterota bacterium]
MKEGIMQLIRRTYKPALVAFIGAGLMASLSAAGSLTPSAGPTDTMYSLANIYDSIASNSFDSSGITADQNGSLMQSLKYIAANIDASLWASDSYGIYETDRNIGIGTASPLSQLSIFGSTGDSEGIRIQPNGWPYYTRIGHNGTSGGDFFISSNYNEEAGTVDSNVYGTSAIGLHSTNWGGGFITFATNTNNSAPTDRMIINQWGNVGIGTADPSTNLDVIGNASVSQNFMVKGHAAFGNTASVDPNLIWGEGDVVNIDETPTFTNDAWETFGQRIRVTADEQSTISPYAGALDAFTQVPSDYSLSDPYFDIGGGLIGVANYGIGSIRNAIGLTLDAVNGQFGGPGGHTDFLASLYADTTVDSGTASTAYGVLTGITNFDAGNTIASASALTVEGLSGPGLTKTYYGIQVLGKDPYTTPNVTTAYGLYIDDYSQFGGSNKYNLYSDGANSLNYFAGNVGIGTTTPTAKLALVGLASISGDIARNVIIGTSGTTIYGPSIGFDQGGIEKFVVYNPVGTNDLNFASNGSLGQMVIKGLSGNVGIGTLVPTSRFAVVGSAGNYDVLDIASSSGASLLHVTKGGNVGIGTANPAAKLQVNGTASISDRFEIIHGNGASLKLTDPNYGNNTYYVRSGFGLFSVLTSTSYTAIGVNGVGNVGIGAVGATSPQAALHIATGASDARDLLIVAYSTSERFRITIGGNAGLGTNNPKQKLDVIGNIEASASGNVDMILKSTSATGDDGKFTIRSVGSFDRLDFLTGNNTIAMSIASSGNVGIGTTAPDQKLDVAGNITASTSGNVALILKSTSASGTDGQFSLLTASTSDRLDIRGGAGAFGSTFLSIASTGFVGVGTIPQWVTRPARPLDVYGSTWANLTGSDLRVLDGSNIGAGITLLSYTDSTLATLTGRYTLFTTGAGISGTITPGSFALWNNTTSHYVFAANPDDNMVVGAG